MSSIKSKHANDKSNQLTQGESKIPVKTEELDPPSAYQILIENGEADKLSPKSTGKIYFELARYQVDGCNYLRIKGNEGGGLHSREWVSVEKVINTLSTQAGHPFKSSVLKTCTIGKSSNNASFLAAILRSSEIKLIQATEKNTFSHLLVDDFEKLSAALLKRNK